MKRQIFYGLLLGLTTLLAGCQESAQKNTSRASEAFHAHDRCHLCGMVITRYEGPKGEIFIKKIDEAIKFCSSRDAFTFALQPENARRLENFYVHDMGRTTWDKPQDEVLIEARTAVYVYGSRKIGTMGVEVVPFSNPESAQKFVEQWGGRILTYKDITLSLLAQDGQ